jgi:hypothetical protein
MTLDCEDIHVSYPRKALHLAVIILLPRLLFLDSYSPVWVAGREEYSHGQMPACRMRRLMAILALGTPIPVYGSLVVLMRR